MSKDGLHPKAIPPFASLRAFEAVGRLGGIRKAAASLSLDHAVVSRHVRQLEEWLRVELCHRTGARIELTEAGRVYHRRISAAITELAASTLEIQQVQRTGPLQVWCVPGLAAQWLTHRLAEYEQLYPEDQVELRPTDHMADLYMLEADVDIRFYGDDWQPQAAGRGLRSLDLARPPIMAIASQELVDRLGSIRSIQDLASAPLLHEEHDRQWFAWFRLNGLDLPSPIAGPLLWHAHLAIAAARAGRGVALANPFLLNDDLATGRLVEIDVPGMRRAVIGSYAFVARNDRWNDPRIAQLRSFLHRMAQRQTIAPAAASEPN